MFNNGDVYEKNENGKVYCGKNIMLSIINLAAKEISGVASLCPNFGGSKLGRLLNSNNYFEGVKLLYHKDGLIVDVYINVYSNYNVADVACRVQENIKSGITSMTDIRPKEINIHVLGVEFNNNDKKPVATS